MKVNFLSPNESYSVIKSAQYLNFISSPEIQLRIGKDGSKSDLLKYYKHQLVSFLTSEQQVIQWYISMMIPYVSRYAPKLLIPEIQFGKFRAGTDWDFPFTVGNTVFLTETYIQSMKMGRITNKTRPILVTLVHELVHINTPAFLQQFEYIYRKHFGFRKVTGVDLSRIHRYIITNPDGYQLEWIVGFRIQNDDRIRWFMPVLVFRNNVRSMLAELDEHYVATGMLIPTESYPLYTNAIYGLRKHNYHPNEIVATLLSEYVIRGRKYDRVPHLNPSSAMYADLGSTVGAPITAPLMMNI